MKLFNTNALVASLMTLTAIAIPTAGNAQYVPSNCALDSRVGYETDVHSNPTTACVREAVETIYNPNPTWQPNL